MNDTTGTVVRTMKIIRAVAEESGPVGITQIAALTGLPPSTVHRLMDLLVSGGFVRRIKSTRKYGIGSDMFWIAHVIAARTPIRDFLQPLLHEITEETGETSLFAIYVHGQRTITYLAKADSPTPIRFRDITLNQGVDLCSTAAGMAILAFLPEETQAEVISGASAQTPDFDESRLRTQLETVRLSGYCVSPQEESIFQIAVPAKDPSGTIIGALTIVMPALRFQRSRTAFYFDSLASAARRLSHFDVFESATK